jgi:hypothetical protein
MYQVAGNLLRTSESDERQAGGLGPHELPTGGSCKGPEQSHVAIRAMTRGGGDAMPYQSNNNAVLYEGCRPLQNLAVLLEVTEDISTVEGNGFSLQVNCFPPPGHYVQGQQLNWLQYVVYVLQGQLWWEVQYWSVGAPSAWPPGYTPIPNTTPWLPCWANDYFLNSFGAAPGNKLPRQSKLQISHQTDGAANVSLVKFDYTDPDDNVSSAQFPVPKNALCPISAFTVNLVGPGGGSNCTFTTGLTESRGIFYYSVDPGTLSVQSGGLGSACGEQDIPTGETSNAVYSAVAGAPASTVSQTLGPAVPCAVQSLFAADFVAAEQMRNVRDEHLDAPAGAFLSEVLERHSADLASLLAGDPALAAESRHLFREAARVATEGARFDDELIDRAERLVKRSEALVPCSMSGIPDATRTILAALRGRTLADGIAEASETIMPRYPSPPPPPPQPDAS